MNADVAWLCHLTLLARLAYEDELAMVLDGMPADGPIEDALRRFADLALGSDLPRIQRLADEAVARARTGPPPTPLPRSITGPPETPPLVVALEIDPGSEIDPVAAERVLGDLLALAREEGVSDVHITAGNRASWRRHGRLHSLGQEPLSAANAMALGTVLLSQEMRTALTNGQDVSGALSLRDGGRARINVAVHQAGVAATFHLIPDHPRTLAELGFRPTGALERLLDHPNGMILITGPAGCGKTTTMAALVDLLNSRRMAHIITIEDPIEIVHPKRRCMVSQRELGKHTSSHAAALKAALREDPDVIVVGEMCDLATTELAMVAAETGHLVLATMHTSDAASALNRLLTVFPPSQANQIRSMAAESLRAIIGQRLLPARDETQVLAWELLLNTPAVSNLIRDGRTYHLEQAMHIGTADGMQTMDRCVATLFREGHIHIGTACATLRSRQAVDELRQEAATSLQRGPLRPVATPLPAALPPLPGAADASAAVAPALPVGEPAPADANQPRPPEAPATGGDQPNAAEAPP